MSQLTTEQLADVHSHAQAIIGATLAFEALVKGMVEPAPDPQREAFEKWIRSRHITALERDTSWTDRYIAEHVQSMWEGYQAASKQAALRS
jgi:hypothetical protein